MCVSHKYWFQRLSLRWNRFNHVRINFFPSILKLSVFWLYFLHGHISQFLGLPSFRVPPHQVWIKRSNTVTAAPFPIPVSHAFADAIKHAFEFEKFTKSFFRFSPFLSFFIFHPLAPFFSGGNSHEHESHSTANSRCISTLKEQLFITLNYSAKPKLNTNIDFLLSTRQPDSSAFILFFFSLFRSRQFLRFQAKGV